MIKGRSFTKPGYYDSVGGNVHTGVRMKFGTNTTFLKYWTVAYPFINKFKGSDPLTAITCSPGTVNANGFVDCSTSGESKYILGSGESAPSWTTNVTYVLTWTGTGNIVWKTGNITETNIGAAGYPTVNRREYVLTGTPTTNWVTHTGGAITAAAMFEKTEETRFDAGNIMSAQYLSDMAGIDTLRCMDWMDTVGSWIADVADLTPYTERAWKQMTNSPRPFVYRGAPIQALCEAVNELECDLWMNIPPHATDAMVTEIGNLIETHLDAARSVYIEWGNEMWNSAAAFLDSWAYCRYFDAPNKTATVDTGTDICTNVAHGMTGGEEIRTFDIAQHQEFGYGGGAQSWADVIDVDTFYISSDSGDLPGSHRAASANTTSMVYKEVSESSKDQPTNFAERSLAVWALIDAAVTTPTVYHVGAGQAADPGSMLTTQLAVAGYREAMDFYAIASYFILATEGTGRTTDDWATQTYAEMAEAIISGPAKDIIDARYVANINALGAYKLVLYEGADASALLTGLSAEDQAHMLGMQRDSEMGRAYRAHLTDASAAGFHLHCNYAAYNIYEYDGGCWGLMEEMGQTDHAKYVACKEFLDNGGVPKP